MFLRDSRGNLKGKLGLVDLAGSERGSDTKQHNSQRRTESADINTSLLALKECIRALGQKSAHVPYRGSKLTLILKDCFSPDSKTTMVATVSPGASATDHSLNTLRYADRIKEQQASVRCVSFILCSQYELFLSLFVPIQVSNTSRSSKVVKSNAASRKPSTKERLLRIAAATQQAVEHHEEFAQKILGEDDDVDTDAIDESLLEQVDEEEQEYFQSDESPDATAGVGASEEGERELRRTVQAVFELEEALLNQHMSNIQVRPIRVS